MALRIWIRDAARRTVPVFVPSRPMSSSLLAAFRAFPRFGGSDSIGNVAASDHARAQYIQGIAGICAFVFTIGLLLALIIVIFSCCLSPSTIFWCNWKRGHVKHQPLSSSTHYVNPFWTTWY